jgi:hypothetical protein
MVDKNESMINQISAGYVFGNMLRSKDIIRIGNVGQIDRKKLSLDSHVMDPHSQYYIYSYTGT